MADNALFDGKKIANALRDTAQSASNSVAANVSAPVDLLALALKYYGVPIPDNPVMGSQWMQDNGLTQPVPEGIPKAVGEAAGVALPVGMYKNAPQIAKRLIR